MVFEMWSSSRSPSVGAMQSKESPMKVSDVMSSPASCCSPYEPLSEAARVMWDRDCGFVPVIELVTNALLGVVTDRDLCMASYTQGRRLSDIPIEAIMSAAVVTCRAEDGLDVVHARMREHALRRLVVVDELGAVEGVLSISDLVRVAERAQGGDKQALQKAVAQTLAEISRPHAERDAKQAESVELKPAAKVAPKAETGMKAETKAKPPQRGKSKKSSKA